MFSRCLFCHRDLPANEALEHYPYGRRLAYDPVRGRLWAVCPACRRWNLAPIEERWEALEELEKTVKDRSRLLSQTDNIALLRAGELEIVRVGRANLTEEAWWRYGAELVKRRRMYQLLTAAGVGGVMALMAGGAAAGVGVFGGWWIIGASIFVQPSEMTGADIAAALPPHDQTSLKQTPYGMGWLLYTSYLIPFEIASMLV